MKNTLGLIISSALFILSWLFLVYESMLNRKFKKESRLRMILGYFLLIGTILISGSYAIYFFGELLSIWLETVLS